MSSELSKGFPEPKPHEAYQAGYDAAAASKQAEIDALEKDNLSYARDVIRLEAELAELRQDSHCGVRGHVKANWVEEQVSVESRSVMPGRCTVCDELEQVRKTYEAMNDKELETSCAAERERLGRVLETLREVLKGVAPYNPGVFFICRGCHQEGRHSVDEIEHTESCVYVKAVNTLTALDTGEGKAAK